MPGYSGDSATTADFVAFHAAERPDALALASGDRTVTYAQFDSDLRRFAQAVGDLMLPRASSAAVGCDDPYAHWLLLLALEHHGIASASLLNVESPGTVALRGYVDCVLAAPGFSIAGARLHRGLSAEWFRDAWAGRAYGGGVAAPASPEEPVRILQSSGTTGAPKRIVLLRRMFEARVRQFAAQFEFSSHSRYLLTAGFNVWHIYGVATACLRSGGTIVSDFVEGKSSVAQAISKHGVTHVSMFPIVLKQVLDELPRDFVKPSNLTIHSFGAAISEPLRERALERLAVDFFRNYGCNEAAAAYVSRAPGSEGFGSVWPDTTVEIVDDDDRPLPHGKIGRIRLRTACMVQGYPDDPEATGRYFKDGWFYPEDMGVLNNARQLKVIGRRDEMLNIGGEKVPPESFESEVLKRAEVSDVGVCSFVNAVGVEEVYFAVSFQQGDTAEILSHIADAFKGFALGAYYVVRLPAIPRNAGGKIQRDLLKQAVAAAAGSKS